MSVLLRTGANGQDGTYSWPLFQHGFIAGINFQRGLD